MHADQQSSDAQQQALEASKQWLQHGHKLIAATLTSSKQEEALEAALASALEQQQQQGLHGPDVQQLKSDMLRVEALLAHQLQVRTSSRGAVRRVLLALRLPPACETRALCDNDTNQQI